MNYTTYSSITKGIQIMVVLFQEGQSSKYIHCVVPSYYTRCDNCLNLGTSCTVLQRRESKERNPDSKALMAISNNYQLQSTMALSNYHIGKFHQSVLLSLPSVTHAPCNGRHLMCTGKYCAQGSAPKDKKIHVFYTLPVASNFSVSLTRAITRIRSKELPTLGR